MDDSTSWISYASIAKGLPATCDGSLFFVITGISSESSLLVLDACDTRFYSGNSFGLIEKGFSIEKGLSIGIAS